MSSAALKLLFGFQTRVLVTHGIQFLPEVDEVFLSLLSYALHTDCYFLQVIVLVDGMVTEAGPYDVLLRFVRFSIVQISSLNRHLLTQQQRRVFKVYC